MRFIDLKTWDPIVIVFIDHVPLSLSYLNEDQETQMVGLRAP